MSLSTSIDCNSISSPPSPKVQSLGKNGSFWIPERLSDQNINSKMANSNKKSRSLNSENQSRSEVSGNLKNKNINPSNISLGFEKKLKISTKLNNTKSVPEITKTNFSNVSVQANHQTINVSTVGHVKLSGTFANDSNNLYATTTSAKESKTSANIFNHLLYSSKSNSTDKDGDQKNGKNRNRNGINNASCSADMEFLDKNSIKFSSIVKASDALMCDSNSVSKFVDFVGKSVLPRLAYLSRFEKKIVRFAIDLPNGEKMGVRLEKSPSGFSICFIADNRDVRELLDSCKSLISNNLNKSNSSLVDINIFSDYQEMDKFFNKAA